jgi:hypothetical protein
MEVSDQLHYLAALPPEGRAPYSQLRVGCRTPWTLWRREKSLSSAVEKKNPVAIRYYTD